MATNPSSGTSKSSSGDDKSLKAPNGKSTPQKRDSLVSLRKHMDEIAVRLNQADTLTQRSVGSLQNAFSVLERRVNHEGTVNKAALTKRVDQLTQHLTGLISQTRAGVAQDLRQARDNPSLSRLQAAVDMAEKRLAQAELAQAAALSKVNSHIAQLARAIDTRLTEEVSVRNQALNNVNRDFHLLQAHTREKISDIERSSAQAITRLGEHVVSLSQDFKQRTENNTQAVSAKMSTLALKTQKEFEDYKSQIERRMESLEENQRNLDSYTDRSLAGVTTRIDNLEYGLTSVAPPAAATQHNDIPLPAPEPIFDDPFAPDPVAPSPSANPMEPLLLEPEHITPQLKLVTNPAPAPTPPRTLEPAPSATPKPFLTPPPSGANAGLSPANSPVEYVPEPYLPSSAMNMGSIHAPLIQDIVPVAPPSQFPQPAPTNSAQLYVASDSLAISGQSPNASDLAVADLIGTDDLPYEDPAYAEHISGADMKRPGAFDLKRKGVAGGPKISGRNIRVGVMALCVATIGYFALRGFVTRDTQTLAENGDKQSLFVEQVEPGQDVAVNSQTPSGTAPAIGNYEDNQGLGSEANTSVSATLEAAAKSGDPVAEFQLGLSRLESGQTKEAVDLIRASANKGQPAAQYRLAKLYEAGQGVTADAKMARQLTERAASNGNRIAMHDLALYYAEGRGGVEINIQTAASWFEKAALRGVVDSQYNLGVLYESGQGLPKNLTEAFVWYSVAAAQGDQFARKHIDLLKQQLSADDLKRAETRISAFTPIALDEAANGIFKNVSWAQPAPEKEARVHIKEAQTLLGQLGYKVGRPDGAMGPQTRKAIVSFQKDRGLSETGSVDAALVIQLQRAAGA